MKGQILNEENKQGQALPGDQQRQREPWQRPKILSVEPLEAAATICDSTPAYYGKVSGCLNSLS